MEVENSHRSGWNHNKLHQQQHSGRATPRFILARLELAPSATLPFLLMTLTLWSKGGGGINILDSIVLKIQIFCGHHEWPNSYSHHQNELKYSYLHDLYSSKSPLTVQIDILWKFVMWSIISSFGIFGWYPVSASTFQFQNCNRFFEKAKETLLLKEIWPKMRKRHWRLSRISKTLLLEEWKLRNCCRIRKNP